MQEAFQKALGGQVIVKNVPGGCRNARFGESCARQPIDFLDRKAVAASSPQNSSKMVS